MISGWGSSSHTGFGLFAGTASCRGSSYTSKRIACTAAEYTGTSHIPSARSIGAVQQS